MSDEIQWNWIARQHWCAVTPSGHFGWVWKSGRSWVWLTGSTSRGYASGGGGVTKALAQSMVAESFKRRGAL